MTTAGASPPAKGHRNAYFTDDKLGYLHASDTDASLTMHHLFRVKALPFFQGRALSTFSLKYCSDCAVL